MAKTLVTPENVCLIIAASIRPNALADVSIVDPVAREADYLDALGYYLEHHPRFRRIVFIENSGWPLDKFVELAARVAPDAKFEPISLKTNDFPPQFGKSYGEMLLLEKGVEQSTLAKESFYLAKLTGRMRLTNLTRLVESQRRHFDLMCDIADHPLYEWFAKPATGRKADTRFYMFRLRYWNKYIRGRLDEVDERGGECTEDFFYRLATTTGNGEMIVNRLRLEPAWAGRAGHGSKDYSSRGERRKRLVRNLLRRFMPALKL